MLSELLFLSIAVSPFEEPGPFGNDCRHSATRQASADVSGARRIRIEALAGSLKIEGRAGAVTVGAHGRACAESESLLGQVQLEVRRQADEVVVRVKLPEEHGWGDGRAWLDLVVDVPDSVPLDVQDTSGAARIRRVGALEVEDSSGELIIEGVDGDLRVRDSSGSVEIRDVTGEVRVHDGSGEIQVRSVGSLIVESDGAGSIEVAGVKGDVLVKRDGSGSIDVEDVGGDLTVARDGSGSVHHRDVRGRTQVPHGR